ncbi:MAG TPA: hypothetical protein VFR86_22920 [Burkholderiaceae bacterium]|nr:hypothetical protein [Burkholderiaceae bacterium]
MSRRRFVLFALVLSPALGAQAAPPNMALAEYLARKNELTAAYVSLRAACNALWLNGREICLAEAMAKDVVAKADLEVAYRSTPKTRYEALQARAEAAFWVAREHCGAVAPALRAGCVQDAKAVEMAARADAKVRMKASEAKIIADEDSAMARERSRQTAPRLR